MCLAGQMPAAPSTAADAVAMAQAALSWLAKTDVASLTTAEQADCLRGLERASSMHIAARSRVLSAFNAQAGHEDDGQGSARTWLKWQTRITGGAAYGALGWMHRQAGHPAVGDALGAGEISESWARQICDWTDMLPEDVRGDADVFLLGAAAGGAELRDLGKLAEEIRRQCARPDTDGDDGFAGRSLRLDTTFEGAGKLDGNLSPQCAAALQAVLDALGKRRGPEDERTKGQRLHDALEDACGHWLAFCIMLMYGCTALRHTHRMRRSKVAHRSCSVGAARNHLPRSRLSSSASASMAALRAVAGDRLRRPLTESPLTPVGRLCGIGRRSGFGGTHNMKGRAGRRAALRPGDDSLRVIGRVGSATGALLAGLHHAHLDCYGWHAGLRALEEGKQHAGAAWQG
ncbi:MAG: DUF222 domain-containing protein [Streptosporangiaceae bacterium]